MHCYISVQDGFIATIQSTGKQLAHRVGEDSIVLLGKFVSLCAAFDNENKTQTLYMNGDKVEHTGVSLSHGDCFPLLTLFYICAVCDI